MFEQNMISQIMWRVEVKIASHIFPSKLRKLHTLCQPISVLTTSAWKKKQSSHVGMLILKPWQFYFNKTTKIALFIVIAK